VILASAFFRQLQAQPFQAAPVYLLYGDEPLFLRDGLDQLRQRLSGLGFEADERFEVDASFDWRGFEFDLMTDSLFARQRYFILHLPKGNLGKEGLALLEKWLRLCEGRTPDTVLILTCERLESRQVKSKWVKLVESVGLVVQAKSVPMQSLPNWLIERAQLYQLQLQMEAAHLLAERIEGNLLAADQELQKLSLLFPAGSSITVEQVQAMVVDQAHYQLFALSSTILQGQLKQSLQMYQRLRQEGVELAVILWLLISDVRQLDELAQLSEQSGLAQAFESCRIWKFKQAEYRAALQRAPTGFWRQCLGVLARIDQLMKGMRPSLNEQQIDNEVRQLITQMIQCR